MQRSIHVQRFELVGADEVEDSVAPDEKHREHKVRDNTMITATARNNWKLTRPTATMTMMRASDMAVLATEETNQG